MGVKEGLSSKSKNQGIARDLPLNDQIVYKQLSDKRNTMECGYSDFTSKHYSKEEL